MSSGLDGRVIRQAPLGAVPRALGPALDRPLDPELRAAFDRAADDAYRRGFDEGRRAGRSETAEAAESVRRAVETGVARLVQSRADTADEAVDLAIAMADVILGFSSEDDGRRIVQRVQAALAEIDDLPLTVAVSPPEWNAIAELLDGAPGLTIEADRRLGPGEARIVGTWAEADLTRHAALEAIRETLL